MHLQRLGALSGAMIGCMTLTIFSMLSFNKRSCSRPWFGRPPRIRPSQGFAACVFQDVGEKRTAVGNWRSGWRNIFRDLDTFKFLFIKTCWGATTEYSCGSWRFRMLVKSSQRSWKGKKEPEIPLTALLNPRFIQLSKWGSLLPKLTWLQVG